MSGSPLDPLAHMLISVAIFVGDAALATLSAVMFRRWLKLHWSWVLPSVLLGPLLWSFDQTAAAFAAIAALLTTTTGARWHQDDLRHGADRAQNARDRRTPLDAGRERVARRGVGGGSTAKGSPSAATSAGGPSKALAGETYAEPHYLHQAQRYLGHAVRALKANGRPVTVMTLSEAMVPDKLEWLGRALSRPTGEGRP